MYWNISAEGKYSISARSKEGDFLLLAWSITAGARRRRSRVRRRQNRRHYRGRKPKFQPKNENVRRANRIIQTRSFVLMILMGVVMFVLLFFRLFDLQITRHEELQGKAVNQQTRRTVVTANRGTIYDAGGNILAISSSAETIILSPLEIDNAVNDTEIPSAGRRSRWRQGWRRSWAKDASAIRKRMDNVKSQYEVIQLRADEDTAAKVRSYVDENKIAGVHLVADTKRYYPTARWRRRSSASWATRTRGCMGWRPITRRSWRGQSGLVISSKDQAENDMLYTYEQYFAAKNGSDLTLDAGHHHQVLFGKGFGGMVDKFSTPPRRQQSSWTPGPAAYWPWRRIPATSGNLSEPS